MSEMEKQALTAKMVGLLRHPPLIGNVPARKALEAAVRERKFQAINERGVRVLQGLKVDKAAEKASRHIFFPGKGLSSKVDPLKAIVPKITGKGVVNTLADNPELLPMMVMPLRGGTVPVYMGLKSALYKGLKIPTPSHMRHLKQREKHMEIALATGAGAGMTTAGIAGHQAMGESQRKRKARDSRAKRADMYKAAAAEIEKIAVSAPWLKSRVASGMAKATPDRARKFIANQENEITALRGKRSPKDGTMRARQIQRRQVAGDTGVSEHLKAEEARLRGKHLQRSNMLGVRSTKKGIPGNRAPHVSPTPAEAAASKEHARAYNKKTYRDKAVAGRENSLRLSRILQEGPAAKKNK